MMIRSSADTTPRAPKRKRKSEVERLLDWSVKLARMRRETGPNEFYGLTTEKIGNPTDYDWCKDYFDTDDERRLGLKYSEMEVIFLD